MKVSELWLRSFVNPHISTEQWIEQFINLGLEVDSIENVNLPQKDTVLTLKVSPNRSDCLSMEGLAREWACINQTSFKAIQPKPAELSHTETLVVQLDASEACPRYVGRIIKNIDNRKQTPAWMQERLEKAGLRLVSPVVDITNYVMLELGQPLHAFDLNKMSSPVIVRLAKKGEKIETLEGVTLELDNNSLVIADKQKILALAGIIGGSNSAVSETTTSIFLESAYFDPIRIRQTAQRFKIRTDSSQRFERGMDPNLQMKAIERATELLKDIVGGEVGPLVEETNQRYLPASLIVPLRKQKIKNVLGIDLPDNKIKEILLCLGMELKQTELGWDVLIPSHRTDITLDVDLIEELARMYGYHAIPEELPTVPVQYHVSPEEIISLSKIKQFLIGRGYNEAITYSFISPEYNQILGDMPEPLKLSNPLSQEMSIMRKSLLPGLLQVAKYNQVRQTTRLRLFETGACFIKKPEGDAQNNIVEKTSLAGLLFGPLFNEEWANSKQTVDFFDIKNDIEGLFQLNRRIDTLEYKTPLKFPPILHPGQSTAVFSQDELLGYVGSMHPAVLAKLDLQGPIYVFELDLNGIQTLRLPKFKEISKFPAIRRDIAVIVKTDILAEQLKSAIVDCVGSLLKDILIFDVYQGKGIEPGHKSVALGLILQHPSRTLVDEEIQAMMEKVVQALKQRFQAILRE